MILAILNLHVAPMPPTKFGLNLVMVREQMWVQDFQDGCPGSHPRYPNRRIKAILNLYVSPMLPIMFWLNPTYGLGDVM